MTIQKRIAILLVLAPALGHATNFVGYTGQQWGSDYGVLRGECDAMEISQLTANETPVSMATMRVNESFFQLFSGAQTSNAQKTDSHCLAHALELLPAGRTVHWKNPETGSDTYFTFSNKSDACRIFSGVTINGTKKTRLKGQACSDGKAWAIDR